jgi:hypothetical protein
MKLWFHNLAEKVILVSYKDDFEGRYITFFNIKMKL